jgi:excisionase family DNA binding protein
MSPDRELLATDLQAHLERIEALLVTLVERHSVKEWYTTSEAAKLLGVSQFTLREWCRLGRCHAKKRSSGRGAHASWTLSREEILRLEREGLLPLNIPRNH